MSDLQSLSVFVTERLTLAAQEIFKVVEETVTQYQQQIYRSTQENSLLKRRLQEEGISFYPELQPSFTGIQKTNTESVQPAFREPWVQQNEEMHVKLELSATQEATQTAPPQISMVEESISLRTCLENEQNMEETFHAQTENNMDSLLQAGPFMQIKEEPGEALSGLRSEAFCESQTCISDDPGSAMASGHASSFEGELESHRLSSVHKPVRSKFPLMSRARSARQRRYVMSYDPATQDKDLIQWRERCHMKRARGINKLPRVGRERKMEARAEIQRALRKKLEKSPDIVLVDDKQSLPTQFQTSPENMNEEVKQHAEHSLEMYAGPHNSLGLMEGNMCVVCGRTFSSRGLLKIHLRVHSGEKPYHCHFCDKNFRQSSHLSVHIRIHTGEKPYSCPTCGKRFSDRSACNRHVKAHLEKDPME